MGYDANCGGMLSLSATRIDEVWAEIVEATADVEELTADLPDEAGPAEMVAAALANELGSECPACSVSKEAIRARDPTGKGRTRRAMRWKPALNAFAITFEGRITLSEN